MAQIVRVAMIQFKKDCKNKQRNIDKVSELTRQASKTGKAKIVMLPECFNSPYDEDHFQQNAETIPGGITFNAMSKLAKECGVYLIAGTWPERDASDAKRLHNTMVVFGPDGQMVAKHRKMHLFDVNIQNAISFTESNSFTPGRDLNTFDAFGLKFGLGICHDSAFPELAMLYRKRGCDVLVYPSAYHTSVGPRIWDMVFRARANDNQVYVAAISEALDRDANYTAYGHTMMVDPWGNIMKQAGTNEEIVYADIDPSELKKVRTQQPIFNQRRTDLYDTEWKQRNN